MDVIARLEYELAYYDSAVHRFHRFNHYTTRTPTRWERWSTGNCARDWNFTIWRNDTCTNQNLSKRIRCIKFSGILRYNQITLFQLRIPNLVLINRKENPVSKRIYLSSRPLNKNKIMQKNRQIFGPCQNIKKLRKMRVTLGKVLKDLEKKTGGMEYRKKNRDNPDYNSVKIR